MTQFFLNNNAKKLRSKIIVFGKAFECEYIAFTKDSHSYLITAFGDIKFPKSKYYFKILNSIKPHFSGINQPIEERFHTTELDHKFTRYEFKDFSLSVPNTMELRDENSPLALAKDIFIDKLESVKKVKTDKFDFVFQPAGTNDLKMSKREINSPRKYSRILINHLQGTNNDFIIGWNDNISTLEYEYSNINKIYKEDLLSDADELNKRNINVKILEVENIKIGKTSKKMDLH